MKATRMRNANREQRGKVEFVAEGAPLPVPNKPGLWLFTLTGDKLRVVKRGKVLFFEAGTWTEEEKEVPKDTPTKAPAFVQLHRVIDIEVVKLSTN